MEWRSAAALIVVGVVLGFVVRSGMKAAGKVIVVLVALVVANAIAPEGLPDLARRGVTWVYDRVAHGLSDVADKARKTTAD